MADVEYSVTASPSPRSQGNSGPILTPELTEAFLDSLRGKGCAEETISTYRRELAALSGFLPEDKRLRRGTLAAWRNALLEQGLAPRTANQYLAAANSLLEYCGRRELQTKPVKPAKDIQPELTRTEYLRLLQTARVLGRERVYLLVKLFGSTGLPVQGLSRITVEAVRAGQVTVSPSGVAQIVRIPACLRGELLDYARRSGLSSGPMFRTREGRPLDRTNATEMIRALCRAAQVAEEKGTPRCLKKLYRTTMAGIQANIALLVEQTHERLLETEQLSIGWEQREEESM